MSRRKRISTSSHTDASTEVTSSASNGFDRLRWTERIILLAFSIGVLLSGSLWLSAREYPLTPIIPHLPSLPSIVGAVLAYGFVGLMLVQAVTIMWSWQRALTLSIGVLLCLLDQSRMQVWVYQYLLMLSAFVFLQPNDIASRTRTLNALRLVLVAVYAWGGLQKLNGAFVDAVFPWASAPLTAHLSFLPTSFVHVLALIFPWIEVMMGVGLIWKRTRLFSVGVIIGMHVIILGVIGPLGYNVDSIILPWNLAMIALVVFLFTGKDQQMWLRLNPVREGVYQIVLSLLLFVAPLLSLVRMWDSYMSFSMYSGNTDEATIYIQAKAAEHLPSQVQEYIKPAEQGYVLLDIQAWAESEFHSAILPEPRFYRSMQSYLCSSVGSYGDIFMIIKSKATPFAASETIISHCE